MQKLEMIENKYFKASKQTVLSMLWLVYLLNVLFRDVHEFIKAEFLEQALSGTINGYEVTEGLLLIGGFVAAVAVFMVFLSATLKQKPNRKMNLILSPLFALSIITNGFGDPDDLLHLVIELAAMIAIFTIAWRWKPTIAKK